MNSDEYLGGTEQLPVATPVVPEGSKIETYVDKMVANEGHSEEGADDIAILPDPLWPEGAVPKHLPPAVKKSGVVDAAWATVEVDLSWRCAECGNTEGRSRQDPRLCNQCFDKQAQATALSKKTNDGWMEQSEALGLALYERQPEETDEEWRIWETYRKFYPMAMPTWSELARQCGCSVAKVTRAAQRWNFRSRMVQWARYADGENQEKRIVAIKQMNEKQLSMAQRLQEKISAAIDEIDPTLLRPGEIANLMKLAVELERKVTTYTDEKVESTAVATQTASRPKTSAGDLSEVLGILQDQGLIQTGSPKVVGVEQKTTILVKEDE